MSKITQLISKLKENINQPQALPAVSTADQLISYLVELTDKKILNDTLQKIKTAQRLPIAKRELAYIPIYYSLERTITVIKNMTVETLRRDIAARFPLITLSPYLRLLFVNKVEQNALLFKLAVDPYINNISQNIGDDRFNELVNQSQWRLRWLVYPYGNGN